MDSLNEIFLNAREIDDPARARLVKLRFFAGLTEEEAAAALGLSRATVQRQWRYARAWLLAELGGAGTRDVP